MNPTKEAFPASPHRTGLSQRELLAAMAMQGLLSNGANFSEGKPLHTYDEIAYLAVSHADALIEQLSKSEKPS